MTQKELGDYGEDMAADYLQGRGYYVIERNFKNKLGEVDIIAKDKGTLCFIEVKTRESEEFGSPFEYVTPAKQKQIAKMAISYFQLKDLDDVRARFDVVAVTLDKDSSQQIKLMKNAFEMG